jgi:predicted transcriptional regulator
MNILSKMPAWFESLKFKSLYSASISISQKAIISHKY